MSHHELTRRRLFFYSGALAAATVGRSPRPARAQIAQGPFAIGPFAIGPFAIGVAAGDPSADGFVIWTRLVADPVAPDGKGGMPDAAIEVAWEVASDEAMQRIVAHGTVDALPDDAHAVHVELRGLAAGRPYWYRFRALGDQSRIGRAVTAPAPNTKVAQIKLALASCSHWEFGYFSAYRHAAAERPDLMLFVGDYLYEYSIKAEERERRAVRSHGRQEVLDDLASYRQRYGLYRTDPDLQDLHANATCLVTWDDHEVQNDYGGPYSERRDFDQATFLALRAAAYKAFWEHMPLRRAKRPVGPNARIYDRLRWGDLAELTLLDGRQYRTNPQVCPDPKARTLGGHVAFDTCRERLDQANSMLGFAQEKWLADGFRHSRARWNVIVQDLLIAELEQPTKSGEWGHWTDAWDGWPATRTRMLRAIRDSKLGNAVFLGGDIHSFWTTDLKLDNRDPRARVLATEFVGTSITHPSAPAFDFAQIATRNPQIRFFEKRKRGYVAIDLTRERMAVRFQAVDDVRDPASGVGTLARFTVATGKPGAILEA